MSVDIYKANILAALSPKEDRSFSTIKEDAAGLAKCLRDKRTDKESSVVVKGLFDIGIMELKKTLGKSKSHAERVAYIMAELAEVALVPMRTVSDIYTLAITVLTTSWTRVISELNRCLQQSVTTWGSKWGAAGNRWIHSVKLFEALTILRLAGCAKERVAVNKETVSSSVHGLITTKNISTLAQIVQQLRKILQGRSAVQKLASNEAQDAIAFCHGLFTPLAEGSSKPELMKAARGTIDEVLRSWTMIKAVQDPTQVRSLYDQVLHWVSGMNLMPFFKRLPEAARYMFQVLFLQDRASGEGLLRIIEALQQIVPLVGNEAYYSCMQACRILWGMQSAGKKKANVQNKDIETEILELLPALQQSDPLRYRPFSKQTVDLISKFSKYCGTTRFRHKGLRNAVAAYLWAMACKVTQTELPEGDNRQTVLQMASSVWDAYFSIYDNADALDESISLIAGKQNICFNVTDKELVERFVSVCTQQMEVMSSMGSRASIRLLYQSNTLSGLMAKVEDKQLKARLRIIEVTLNSDADMEPRIAVNGDAIIDGDCANAVLQSTLTSGKITEQSQSALKILRNTTELSELIRGLCKAHHRKQAIGIAHWQTLLVLLTENKNLVDVYYEYAKALHRQGAESEAHMLHGLRNHDPILSIDSSTEALYNVIVGGQSEHSIDYIENTMLQSEDKIWLSLVADIAKLRDNHTLLMAAGAALQKLAKDDQEASESIWTFINDSWLRMSSAGASSEERQDIHKLLCERLACAGKDNSQAKWLLTGLKLYCMTLEQVEKGNLIEAAYTCTDAIREFEKLLQKAGVLTGKDDIETCSSCRSLANDFVLVCCGETEAANQSLAGNRWRLSYIWAELLSLRSDIWRRQGVSDQAHTSLQLLNKLTWATQNKEISTEPLVCKMARKLVEMETDGVAALKDSESATSLWSNIFQAVESRWVLVSEGQDVEDGAESDMDDLDDLEIERTEDVTKSLAALSLDHADASLTRSITAGTCSIATHIQTGFLLLFAILNSKYRSHIDDTLHELGSLAPNDMCRKCDVATIRYLVQEADGDCVASIRDVLNCGRPAEWASFQGQVPFFRRGIGYARYSDTIRRQLHKSGDKHGTTLFDKLVERQLDGRGDSVQHCLAMQPRQCAVFVDLDPSRLTCLSLTKVWSNGTSLNMSRLAGDRDAASQLRRLTMALREVLVESAKANRLNPKTPKAKHDYWQLRNSLNDRVENLCQDMQDLVLGSSSLALCPPWSALDCKVRKSAVAMAIDTLRSNLPTAVAMNKTKSKSTRGSAVTKRKSRSKDTAVVVDEVKLELCANAVVDSIVLLEEADYEAVAHFVALECTGTKLGNVEASVEALGALQEAIVDLIETEFGEDFLPDLWSWSHTYLHLGPAFVELPWECIPNLNAVPVSRFLSSDHLSRQIDASNGMLSVDFENGRYLINPLGDLKATEKVFRTVFDGNDKAGNVWSGHMGKSEVDKTLKDVTNLTDKHEAFFCGEPKTTATQKGPKRGPKKPKATVSRMDPCTVFLYCGHNAGERVISRSEIRFLTESKLCPPVVLLMGCSSVHLDAQMFIEPTAPVTDYIMGGAQAIVGNLWDVTDRDLDRFCLNLLHEWGSTVPAHPTECGTSSDNGGILEDVPMSLARACMTARQACKMLHLVGAAPVLYGVPMTLASRPPCLGLSLQTALSDLHTTN
eukprot:Clim_evm8s243 gene=Clim_evmTU8s243